MARLVTNYSRIKEMQSKNLNIQDIAEIFDEDPTRLQLFVEYADALVSGEKSFSLSITNKSKAAFEAVAGALAK